ncbi:DUF1828 domain-containing protein, partial [Limosilactobacillus fermentum]|nr:DUF1828 domain-containing protein [Limosilactobacillus fermentum]
MNDKISIYVEHLANGQLRLSDDGYAISNLSFMGTELPMHRKKKLRANCRMRLASHWQNKKRHCDVSCIILSDQTKMR